MDKLDLMSNMLNTFRQKKSTGKGPKSPRPDGESCHAGLTFGDNRMANPVIPSNAVNQQEALPNHDAPVATHTEAVTGGFQHLVSCVTTDLVAATTNSEDRTGYDENISNIPIDIPDTMLGPISSNDENLSEGQKKI
ncbi:unnamed protein product [Cuscuta epithymum]|uniref:Uncharacterized protein n=1 Tax=Cuscuta epithymum TaxID=186058 RepID=A0AAV0GG46_9ASTE|nr:unnamed protein product [Cuscuta epithymum]